MPAEHRFRAPWGIGLRVMTLAASAIIIAPFAWALATRAEGGDWLVAVLALPLALLVITAAFMVRDYRVRPGELLISRPGWTTRIPLHGLREVRADPHATDRSLRLFGNGGLFSITGLFRNARLGRYRAFATKLPLAVVLSFQDRRIVITPDQPERAATAIRRAAGLHG